MILVFELIACSQQPFVFKKKMNQCRITYSVAEQNDLGDPITSETKYNWDVHQDGDRVDFTAISNGEQTKTGYRIYNKQGFVIESYEDGLGELRKEQIDYDCSGEWCWRKKIQATKITDETQGDIEIEYSWRGRTEFYTVTKGDSSTYGLFGSKGRITYNEFFEPIDSREQFENQHFNEFVEYDCSGGWCKIQTQKIEQIFIDERPEIWLPTSIEGAKQLLKEQLRERENISTQEYKNVWTGDRLDWESDYGTGYVMHNKYGYPIEEFSDILGFEADVKNTYDCGEE